MKVTTRLLKAKKPLPQPEPELKHKPKQPKRNPSRSSSEPPRRRTPADYSVEGKKLATSPQPGANKLVTVGDIGITTLHAEYGGSFWTGGGLNKLVPVSQSKGFTPEQVNDGARYRQTKKQELQARQDLHGKAFEKRERNMKRSESASASASDVILSTRRKDGYEDGDGYRQKHSATRRSRQDDIETNNEELNPEDQRFTSPISMKSGCLGLVALVALTATSILIARSVHNNSLAEQSEDLAQLFETYNSTEVSTLLDAAYSELSEFYETHGAHNSSELWNDLADTYASKAAMLRNISIIVGLGTSLALLVASKPKETANCLVRAWDVSPSFRVWLPLGLQWRERNILWDGLLNLCFTDKTRVTSTNFKGIRLSSLTHWESDRGIEQKRRDLTLYLQIPNPYVIIPDTYKWLRTNCCKKCTCCTVSPKSGNGQQRAEQARGKTKTAATSRRGAIVTAPSSQPGSDKLRAVRAEAEAREQAREQARKQARVEQYKKTNASNPTVALGANTSAPRQYQGKRGGL